MPEKVHQNAGGEGKIAKRIGLEVSVAVAEAARLADVDVVAAYPITPQTHIVEHLAELVANGELQAAYVPVESEHSAMSASLGAAAAGARAFTATAGQGLELMAEVLYAVAGMRLPVVMTVVNRALSTPISIWGDHSDVMSVRDCGWIQIFVENGQEAVDNVICAFRIGEDKDVLLPVMVNMDGFHLSHVIEPVIMPEEAAVRKFLPPNDYPFALRPDKPITMGGLAVPAIYTEVKKAQQNALVNSKKKILQAWSEYGKTFGRYYKPVELYRAEGMKTLLLTMGSYSETASLAIDRMREKGIEVGLLKLRLWRPFPFEELKEAMRDVETLIVLDRALSFGGPGGPVCSEIRSAFYNNAWRPKIIGVIAGLGGRDVSPDDFEKIVKRGMEMSRTGEIPEFEMYGVKE
jgi:pyruvate ferredoxin oxidoreductase alpha subunit